MKQDSYEDIQSILEEAGLYHREKAEFNDINSSVIVIDDHILADTNHDNIIDDKDVVVTVDGHLVEVNEIDDVRGIITLAQPVSSGQIVRVKYAYSSVEPAFVLKIRDEALSEIRAKTPCQEIFNDDHIPMLRYIIRLLSAGKLLVRDYGFNEDIENTSKDGYKKIELATQKLNELIASVCGNEATCRSDSFLARDDGDLFPKKRSRQCSGDAW